MKKTFLIMITFLAVANMVEAQQEKFLEVGLIPTLGFNVSYSTFQKGYKKSYQNTEKNISGKDFYYGVGLQFNYMEEWFFSIKYGRSAIGAGFKSKNLYYSNGIYEIIHSYTSSPVNILDANLEKNIITVPFLNKSAYPSNLTISTSIGMRYINIVKTNRADSLSPLPVIWSSPLYKPIGYEKQFRDGGVALSAGLHFQLFIKNHRSLKIGAQYSYLLKPIFEYQFHITGKVYENGAYQTYQEDFNLFPGRHQILFYVSYPIKLFRIKY